MALHPIPVVTPSSTRSSNRCCSLSHGLVSAHVVGVKLVKRRHVKQLEEKVGKAVLNKEVKKKKDSDNRGMYLKEVLTKDTTITPKTCA